MPRLHVVWRNLAYHAPELQHGDSVAELDGFLKLVGDEDDGLPAFRQAAHQGTKFGDACGRQHRGRLVEDEHAAVAQLRAQDLDLLLLAQRQAGGTRREVDGHAELRGDGGRPALEFGEFRPLPPGPAEQQVFGNCQRRHQHRMLENGADAQRQRMARRLDAGGHAIDEDRALVRLLHARQHVDECRLSRTILAQQHVHFAAADGEADGVIGDHAGKPLGHPVEDDDVL